MNNEKEMKLYITPYSTVNVFFRTGSKENSLIYFIKLTLVQNTSNNMLSGMIFNLYICYYYQDLHRRPHRLGLQYIYYFIFVHIESDLNHIIYVHSFSFLYFLFLSFSSVCGSLASRCMFLIGLNINK
jgi:hypothetical protein